MTIVFFLPVILRDQHRHIFPMEQLEREGHKIIVLDATKYFKVYHPTATDEYLLERIRKCNTKEDFVNFKKSLDKEPVIYVTNDLYMSMAQKILNLVIRKQDKLLSASTRYIPGHIAPLTGFKKLARKIIQISDKFLPLHYFKYYYQYVRKIYVSDYFLGSTEYLSPTKTYISVKNRNRFYVHSDDINNIYQPSKQIIDPQKKIGVFLDQMQPYFGGRNPDVHDKEYNKEYKIKYYKDLVKTLEEAKQILGLDDIVIALHPEADAIREEIDKKYYPFRTFTGVSRELIKDAHIVFGHFSTAIGMAAFYRKPIILLTDENLIYHDSRKYVNAYQEELGLKLIRTDKRPLNISKEDLKINEVLFNRYRKRFLKENDYEGNSFYFAIKRIMEDLAEDKENK